MQLVSQGMAVHSPPVFYSTSQSMSSHTRRHMNGEKPDTHKSIGVMPGTRQSLHGNINLRFIIAALFFLVSAGLCTNVVTKSALGMYLKTETNSNVSVQWLTGPCSYLCLLRRHLSLHGIIELNCLVPNMLGLSRMMPMSQIILSPM